MPQFSNANHLPALAGNSLTLCRLLRGIICCVVRLVLAPDVLSFFVSMFQVGYMRLLAVCQMHLVASLPPAGLAPATMASKQ